MISDTYIAPCNHRFCKKCIERALWDIKKECPLCRIKITSKRELIKDEVFDEMLLMFFPELEKTKAQEEMELEELSKSYQLRRNEQLVK